ncbi:MAG: hypothetical protein RIS35_2261 [Pseudomonadota bacterium]|jgi:tRNA threonylcarbamoyladenosine biosynthesis protein TsaB
MSSEAGNDPSRRTLRLLAIGTSTDWCSVSLLVRDPDGTRTASADERAGQSQSRRLLPMIESLLRENNLAMSDLDAIAFDAGPGAFTSLRIGCGVAQGLGFALSIPLIPVGSLEALAEQGGADWTLAATDARMSEVYWAVLRRDGDRLVAVCPPKARDVRDPAAMLVDWRAIVPERPGAATMLAIGDAFERHPQLRAAVAAAGLPIATPPFPASLAIVRLAAIRFDAGDCVPARDAAPLYVRDKVALDVDEQRALRAARAAGTVGQP